MEYFVLHLYKLELGMWQTVTIGDLTFVMSTYICQVEFCSNHIYAVLRTAAPSRLFVNLAGHTDTILLSQKSFSTVARCKIALAQFVLSVSLLKLFN